MQHHFSWWFIDQARSALVNPSTNQHVRYVGRIEASQFSLPSALHRAWMRFEYEDPECRYPLLVEWRNSFQCPGRSIVWRIDHVRSAQLSARQNDSKLDHPPYGLWQRVDVAIADALCCWPPMDAVGPAPTQFWISGGWYNGAWTEGFYRFLSRGSQEMRSRLSAWVPPLDTPAPSPWEFVDQTESQGNVIRSWLGQVTRKASNPGALETSLVRSLASGLPDRAYCGPHLRSRDESRALIPVEYLGSDRDREDGTIKLRLLYIDQDLICDCLTLIRHGSSKTWSSAFDHTVSRIGNGGIAPRHSNLSFKDQPLEIPRRNTVWWADRETVIPRTPLWYRFADAVTEAWLEWDKATLTLPQRYPPKQVQLTVPEAIRVRLPVVANQGSIISGEVADSLASPFSTPDPIALDDYHAAPAAPIRRSVGWWTIDSETSSIRNAASNQRIRLVETPDTLGWASSDWWFQYTDNEVEYPVFVRRRLEPGRSGGAAGVWEIDHERSAEKWRESANRSAPYPSFGLWRRVDDAVTDALYCWRELDQLAYDVRIRSIGGWWNGTWYRDRRRSWGGIARLQLEKLDGTPTDPVLEPLDGPAPPPWTFVECPKDVIRLELAHVSRLSNGAAILPAEAPLEGFRGQTSYLCRADESAVLFPAYAGRRWDYRAYPESEDCYVGIGHFTYANGSEFLSCAFDDKIRGFLTFELGMYGGRTQKIASLLSESSVELPERVLAKPVNYPIWRRFAFDLLEAWPKWRGAGCRLLEDPDEFEALRSSKGSRKRMIPHWNRSGITLDLAHATKVLGGYVAGIYTNSLEMTSSEPRD